MQPYQPFTGTYVGNETVRTITLGFKPTVVSIICLETQSLTVKTDEMTTKDCISISDNINTDGITLLETGFQIEADQVIGSVNIIGQHYYYIAL